MKPILGVFMALAIAALAFPSQGLTTLYTADLDGPSEDPPNASPGTGFAAVDLDTILHTMEIQAEFSDLTGTTTAAHIHGSTDLPGTGTAGVITQLPSFEGFPLGVTSGTYSRTFDTTAASTWNPSFLASFNNSTLEAETALDSYLMAGTAYFNIHTTEFPAGEIRGFPAPVAGSAAPVPEPATLLLIGTGLAGLAGSALRKRNKSRHSTGQ